MGQKVKNIIKDLVPPVLLRAFRGREGNRWCGHYTSWEKAVKASSGYDREFILEKVKEAMLKVKSGEAVYERDSVLFDDIQYSWPLLAALMWIAAQACGKLNITDFGGSLGSSYFQNRKFLDCLPGIRWNIVEQEHFVRAGKGHFENEGLRFYASIDDCLKETSPNSILCSGVAQYLEKPYDLFEKIRAIGFEFILFDRTGLIDGENDRLTVQKVPSKIYAATYPCWFFSRPVFMSFWKDDYELVSEFDALAGVMNLDGNERAYDKGFIYRRRSHS